MTESLNRNCKSAGRYSGWLVLLCSGILVSTSCGQDDSLRKVMRKHCFDCHAGDSAEAGLNLESLAFKLTDQELRDRWIMIHDRVQSREMPPEEDSLSESERRLIVDSLNKAIAKADRTDIDINGRGPMRRLTREEFEQNLRDVLHLPLLDIRDMLPEDRVSHHFNKTSNALDISRVQLVAYLEASESALQQAMAADQNPPAMTKYRAIGTRLFSANNTFGEREAMFFAKDNRAVATKDLAKLKDDPKLELALFRSAHWPYYGYPRGFVAKLPGVYRVRFSARAILQTEGYQIKPATRPVPMTFRARKPSGPDVSGDVRATGGIMDIQPETKVFETKVRLLPTETFEYSLLGLPVPLARNVNGGPPTYRYPPFPEGGQPGVAFQWLEIEGPLPPSSWPPPSHRVLFDELDANVSAEKRVESARKLIRRFVTLASREPIPKEAMDRFEQLVVKRLEAGDSFESSMLAGYKAFLCSSYFLYLREPSGSSKPKLDHYAIASRLSHFLANTRPDKQLLELANSGQLCSAGSLRQETNRLIDDAGFERFVKGFTDYWLDLRKIRRDEPDIRLFPEYRFDDYLVESMARETHTFFREMIRQNLSVATLIDSDFVYANDRLAAHYGLNPVQGSALRQVRVPDKSPYGGLLTQAAIMKVTSNGTSTSPVVRGAWIMERLLGQPPPPPPKNIPAVEPDIRGAKTIRELLALHTKSDRCAGCHARFDPVGLALENFDILGGWRDRYRAIELSSQDATNKVSGIDRAGHDFGYWLAETVDASGKLRDGRQFQNIHDLKALLSKEPRQLARNLLYQFVLYSTGTPVRFSDRAEVESILNQCAPQGFRVRDLIHALVQNRIFLGKDGGQ